MCWFDSYDTKEIMEAMMMRAAGCLALGAILTLCSLGCTDLFPPEGGGSDDGVPLPGTYSYLAFDEEGTLLVSGHLALAIEDTSHIKGTWKLQAVTSNPPVPAMIGEGTLDGGFVNDTVSIDLNPGWVDNNVFLLGKKSGSRIEGTWEYVGFPGVIATGTFAAVREGKTTDSNSTLKSLPTR